ncbi:MAG: DNA-directed RNA polymerase subunit alpha [Elusimicrobia bacterium RIFCSPLOWO2_01_FULL_59_12]|nr:MAG: DNA-directed RNA polymerase subunit alpha [Elusimicrobia bacterium RIFCSPLOWO2_01_FULL_59_12]
MRLRDLVLPQRLECDQDTLTDTYGRFYAEPFEKGYGHTIGNSLRRILLSSLEGCAITAVKIDKVVHEYSTLKGIREDAISILLNLKQLRFKLQTPEPEILRISVKGEKVVRAKDIEANANVEILTPELPIATLDSNGELNMQMWVVRGRGYVPADRQLRENYPADSMMLDALFSPVIKVHYDVENSRVGQVTDYDRLVLDVWTDGSVAPGDAIAFSAKILKDSLSIFITFEEEEVPQTEQPAAAGGTVPLTPDVERLRELLGQPVDIIELSVRASNCLKAAKIRTIGDLVSRKDDELISYKNFGKKSLDEIKERLTELNLSLGMDVGGLLQTAGKAS